MPIYDQYFLTKKCRRKMRKSTMGWSFQIKWKSGSTEWVPLKDLKETNPVDVSKYVTACGVEKETVFVWWATYILCKRDVIMLVISLRLRKCSQKYGMRITTLIAHTKRIEKMVILIGRMPPLRK